jgi:hypothetical protein
MGQIVVNVGSFDLTSHNGNSAYSSTRYFSIPANAGITSCVATFATHVNTGNFQGKAFSLNGVQAHPNTPWPTSGISLNPALLSAGQNAFRASIKSQTGLSARWSIGDIYLTIDYTDPSSGEGSQPNGVSVYVTPSILVIGEAGIAISTANPADRWHTVDWAFADQSGSYTVGWAQAYNATITPLMSWCDKIPNSNSGIFTVTVTEYDTPAPPHHISNIIVKEIVLQVPSSAVPSIGDFTAALNSNGVDASITGYVQNYSKADIEIEGAAGALGSAIAAYEITGGGWSANTAAATFGPFAQAGDIVFTAKVTDTRGRTVTGTVTISVLSYGPPAFSNPEAWRSSDAGVKNQKGTYARLKSGVVYSSLDGQNSVTLKGMVHIKGGTVPAYTSMTPDTPWITGGGLLLVTKTYIARMLVEDLISARIVEFTIPTKKTGISIMAGMRGIAFGKYAEIEGYAEFGWPIYNCPYEVGDILQTLNTSSPEDRWPGTEWESIAGRVLVGIDSTQSEFDTAGEEGGEKTHTLTQAELPDIPANPSVPTICSTPNNTGGPIVDYHILGSQTTSGYSVPGIGADLGSGEAHNNLQPYKVVYMWLRTA